MKKNLTVLMAFIMLRPWKQLLRLRKSSLLRHLLPG